MPILGGFLSLTVHQPENRHHEDDQLQEPQMDSFLIHLWFLPKAVQTEAKSEKIIPCQRKICQSFL
ncbi:hypothetical protein ABB02_00261 [Clostridiaceae bacterium JG1575]|nr:hypothetical protein ABB02_00261 [Clostridiaceae bacterium JG1575]